MHNKKLVLFQLWAVWYCHNHPDKTVGNAKAITVTKDFAASHVGHPPCLDHRKRQTLRQLLGNMTNNQFSALSEIVKVLEG